MAKIPDWNVPSEQVPWLRWAQGEITRLSDQVDRLKNSSGNANSTQDATLRVLGRNIVDLQGRVDEAIAGIELDMSQVPTGNLDQSRVTGTWSKPVAAVGAISSTGDATVGGIIRSPVTYSNPITTSFRSVWVTSVDGQLGYNLSTRRAKQDIESAIIDPETVLLLRLVWFRYIAAVEAEGDDAEVYLGLIAEEVHDLGLTWLVEYDEEGLPCGVKFHLVAMALLAVAQNHEERLMQLESRVG